MVPSTIIVSLHFWGKKKGSEVGAEGVHKENVDVSQTQISNAAVTILLRTAQMVHYE